MKKLHQARKCRPGYLLIEGNSGKKLVGQRLPSHFIIVAAVLVAATFHRLFAGGAFWGRGSGPQYQEPPGYDDG